MVSLRRPIIAAIVAIGFITAIGCTNKSSGGGGTSTDTRVTGTWAGNYQTTSSGSGSSSYSGSLTLKMTQSGTALVGTASGSDSGLLVGVSTSGTFTSQQLSGSVSGQTLDFVIYFGAYKATMHGTVSDDTSTLNGVWSGDFTSTGADTCNGSFTVLRTSSSSTS